MSVGHTAEGDGGRREEEQGQGDQEELAHRPAPYPFACCATAFCEQLVRGEVRQKTDPGVVPELLELAVRDEGSLREELRRRAGWTSGRRSGRPRVSSAVDAVLAA